jgi:hypothetical protein
MKLEEDWIYTLNALNDIPGMVFNFSQRIFTCSIHFEPSAYLLTTVTHTNSPTILHVIHAVSYIQFNV